MIDDFIPSGGVRVSHAIWYLATQRHPSLWALDQIEEGEQAFWLDVIHVNADVVSAALQHVAAGNQVRDRLTARLQSYVDAETEVRQALYASKLQAFFISTEATTHGELMHVLATGWASEAGLEILRWGRADLQGEKPGRLIIFDKGLFNGVFEIGAAAKRANPSSTPSRPATKGKRGRPQTFPWPAIEAEAMRLLDEHGGIDPLDDVLPNQAALESILLLWCAGQGAEPSLSSLRGKLPGWIAAYNAGATRQQRDVSK